MTGDMGQYGPTDRITGPDTPAVVARTEDELAGLPGETHSINPSYGTASSDGLTE